MPGGTNYRPTAFRSAFPQPYLPSHPSGLPCRLAVLLRLPPLPGGHRGGVSPQPAAMPASVVLETAELVAAVELDVPPCQPGPNHLGVDELPADPFVIDSEGFLKIPTRPGLGIDIDPARLKRFCPDRIEFR